MISDDLLSNAMLLLGLGLAAFVLLRRMYRRTRRQSTGSPPAGPVRSSANRRGGQPLMDAPPEAARWQVEMHEVARELKAELDSKSAVLQTLVAMLREETDRLERVIERARAAGLGTAVDSLAEIEQMAQDLSADAHRFLERADPKLQRLAESAEPLPAETRRRIAALAAEGRSVEEIAEELELPRGEVELTLSLKPE